MSKRGLSSTLSKFSQKDLQITTDLGQNIDKEIQSNFYQKNENIPQKD